ncbi:hypothetical protein Tco_0570220 [Tanacetum coccineum]
MASLSNRSGGGANDASLLEDEDYDIYDGLENDDYDISEEQLTFCDAFDITLRGRVNIRSQLLLKQLLLFVVAKAVVTGREHGEDGFPKSQPGSRAI